MRDVDFEHTPVLLDEVLDGLKLCPDGFYVDCTFGRGGHSEAILQQLGEHGHLLAIDKDPDAIRTVRGQLSGDPRFRLVQGSFTRLQELLEETEMGIRVDGVLFDLGVSSPQFDDPCRGFSFQRDGALDMRMNPATDQSAAEWLNYAREKEIADVLYRYGEESNARRIARKIVRDRVDSPITSTVQLANLVKSVYPVSRKKDRHPATKTFQAIRIFINRELDELRDVLSRVVDVLNPGGRLLVISFHSLEDRIVKRFIRDETRGRPIPLEVPVTHDWLQPRLRTIGRSIRPSKDEIERNPRARSAVLRIAERCPS